MEEVAKVYKTTDYEKFITLDGNRNLNLLHIARLKKSFKEHQLLSPILVNEKYEIIDGQHRFVAAKELGLPVFYITQEGYGITEVKILNVIGSNWTKKDFFQANCNKGLVEYLKMREFMTKFPQFTLISAENLLTDSTNGANTTNTSSADRKKYGKARVFQEGLFKINNLEQATENAEKILQIKKFYKKATSQNFVSAMMGIFRMTKYDHIQLLTKLAFNEIEDRVSVKSYRTQIEEIYNCKSRNKISLFFE